MVTPAPGQLGPGGEKAKELTDKADITGESKECAVNSRRLKTTWQVNDIHVTRPNRIPAGDPVPEPKGSLFIWLK